jgi:hypothetical protein
LSSSRSDGGGDPGRGLACCSGDGCELGREAGEGGDQALGVLDGQSDGQTLELGIEPAQAAASLATCKSKPFERTPEARRRLGGRVGARVQRGDLTDER